MPFTPTDFPGLFVYEPKVLTDNRGYFFESYSEKTFAEEGITSHFIQDNQSFSSYGVIRGLHYQLQPHDQVKLVRAIYGNVLDVAVDLRKESPTYGKVFSIELSADNKKQLLMPQGFAHGFSVLSETAEISYKCSAFYNRESEAGICYNDPELNIDWKIPVDKMVISEKDQTLPLLKDCRNNFS